MCELRRRGMAFGAGGGAPALVGADGRKPAVAGDPSDAIWLGEGYQKLVDTAAQRHSRATWTRVWRQGADYARGEVRRNCEARGSRCARYVPCQTAKLHSASPPQKNVRVVEASSHSCGRSVCEQALITPAAKCGETVSYERGNILCGRLKISIDRWHSHHSVPVLVLLPYSCHHLLVD